MVESLQFNHDRLVFYRNTNRKWLKKMKSLNNFTKCQPYLTSFIFLGRKIFAIKVSLFNWCILEI